MSGSASANIEIVPSSIKRERWASFANQIEGLNRRGLPTSRTLKLIHWIFSAGTDKSVMYSSFSKDFGTSALYTLDRPDGEEKQQLFHPSLVALTQRANDENWSILQYLTEGNKAYVRVCQGDTQIEFTPGVWGKLRSYGRRKIGQGPWETLYAAHECIFSNLADEFIAQATGGRHIPKTYFGLSMDLPEIYGKLCQKYDGLIAQAHEPEERLLAEAFLQVIGTRVVHPFWDGNGRSFMGHLAVELEGEGIHLREYSDAQSLTVGLTANNEQFLFDLLKRSGLRLLKDLDHVHIRLNHAIRQEYMKLLRKGIGDAIELGLDPFGPYRKYYDEAFFIIQNGLVRSKLWHPKGDAARFFYSRVDQMLGSFEGVPSEHVNCFQSVLRQAYFEDVQRLKQVRYSLATLAKADLGNEVWGALHQALDCYDDQVIKEALLLSFGEVLRDDHSPEAEQIAIKIAQELAHGRSKEFLDRYECAIRPQLIFPLCTVLRFKPDDPEIISKFIDAFDNPPAHDLLMQYKDEGKTVLSITSAIVSLTFGSGNLDINGRILSHIGAASSLYSTNSPVAAENMAETWAGLSSLGISAESLENVLWLVEDIRLHPKTTSEDSLMRSYGVLIDLVNDASRQEELTPELISAIENKIKETRASREAKARDHSLE